MDIYEYFICICICMYIKKKKFFDVVRFEDYIYICDIYRFYIEIIFFKY